MAKKYVFRPDKHRPKILDHLMLTHKQTLQVLKWGMYTLFLVLISVVQDVLLSPVRIYGATTELIPCAIFIISILQGPQRGSVFALVASLLYLFSGSAPGIFAMVSITFLSVGVCMFRQVFLQEGFFSCLLCTAGAMIAYELLNFLFGLVLGLTIPPRFVGFLITAGLTLLAIPVIYPLAKAIDRIGGQAWNE